MDMANGLLSTLQAEAPRPYEAVIGEIAASLQAQPFVGAATALIAVIAVLTTRRIPRRSRSHARLCRRCGSSACRKRWMPRPRRPQWAGRDYCRQVGSVLVRAAVKPAFASKRESWRRNALESIRNIENELATRAPLVEASSPSVVSAYEARIEKLEREKIVLAERAAKTVPPKGRLEECIELALRFLSGPWNLYQNGDYVMRQTVLRLAFVKPLRYGQNGVYGTPEFSFPFQYLAGISGGKSEMVLPDRIELSTSPLPRV